MTTPQKGTCTCGRPITEYDPTERPRVWTHLAPLRRAWLGHIPRPAVRDEETGDSQTGEK